MNYVTHALEALVVLAKKYRSIKRETDAVTLETVGLLIAEAPKFLMPAGNRLDIEVKADAFPFIRLPFPVMVLEYPVDLSVYKSFNFDESIGQIHKSSKRVVLLIDSQNINTSLLAHKLIGNGSLNYKERGFFLISMFYIDSLQEWNISTGLAFIPLDNPSANTIIEADPNKTSKLSARLAELFPGFIKDMRRGNISEQDIIRLLQGDLVEDIVISIKALMCFSARNTTYIDVEPPHKLNRKRMKHNKLPYFEYKVLDIFVSPEAKTIRRVHPDVMRSELMKWSSDKIRRLHKVRGHYKCRKSGIWWWNDFIRGSKTKGVIEKDYNVKELQHEIS